jgi:hypothetical protein
MILSFSPRREVILETGLRLILLPGRMTALCSHGSNEQAFFPSPIRYFRTTTYLSFISQHWKGSCRFHDFELPSLPTVLVLHSKV